MNDHTTLTARAEREIRNHVLDKLEADNSDLVRKAQRAMLKALLAGAPVVDADVVFDALEGDLPAGKSLKFLGSVPGPLRRLGIIEYAGFEPSKRPNRHASRQLQWRLGDRAKAEAWLASHPEPTPMGRCTAIPESLFELVTGSG